MTELKLKLEPVDLRSFLEEAVRRHNGPAASKGTYVLLDFISPGRVAVNPSRLGRIVDNLLSIAVSSSMPGKAIEVSARKTQAEWRFHVKYKGLRIAVSDVGQFVQDRSQDPARPSAATSEVGLSATRSMIEAHGGRLGVVAEAGQVVDFWFTLPVRNAG